MTQALSRKRNKWSYLRTWRFRNVMWRHFRLQNANVWRFLKWTVLTTTDRGLGCIKCPDVFKTSCLSFNFVPLIGRCRRAKCQGHRMPSRGSASASTITSSTNISQNIDNVSRKALLWPCKLASKYEMTFHSRNTLTEYSGSPLSFGPLAGPQRVGDRYSKVENSKLSYRPHRMLIRKLLTRKTAFWRRG